jgi:hypothetical protein
LVLVCGTSSHFNFVCYRKNKGGRPISTEERVEVDCQLGPIHSRYYSGTGNNHHPVSAILIDQQLRTPISFIYILKMEALFASEMSTLPTSVRFKDPRGRKASISPFLFAERPFTLKQFGLIQV